MYQEGQQKVITAAESNMCNVSARPKFWTVEQAGGYYDALQRGSSIKNLKFTFIPFSLS